MAYDRVGYRPFATLWAKLSMISMLTNLVPELSSRSLKEGSELNKNPNAFDALGVRRKKKTRKRAPKIAQDGRPCLLHLVTACNRDACQITKHRLRFFTPAKYASTILGIVPSVPQTHVCKSLLTAETPKICL